MLASIDELISWAKDVQEFALAKAVDENKQWPGMKLVEGRGSRKYTNENAIVEALTAAGYDSDVIYKKSLNGSTGTVLALPPIKLYKNRFQILFRIVVKR